VKLKKYTEKQLFEAVEKSFSLAQTLKSLGVVPCGGNYLVLKKQLATSNSTFPILPDKFGVKGKH
jgi:hypothetical protein